MNAIRALFHFIATLFNACNEGAEALEKLAEQANKQAAAYGSLLDLERAEAYDIRKAEIQARLAKQKKALKAAA